MPKLFNRKYIAFVVLLVTSILVSLSYIIPLSIKLHSFIELYLPVLDTELPQLTLVDNKMEMKGELPHVVELENNVHVVFNRKIVDSLFQDVAPKSVFIAADQLWYRTEGDTIELSYSSVDSEQDSVTVEPAKIEQFFSRYMNIIVWGLGVLLFLAFWLLFYLVSLFLAGIGTMIDAFKSGPFSFSHYLNLSSLFLLIFVLVSMLFKPLSDAMLTAAVLLFFVYLILVYILVKIGKHKQRLESL